MCDAGRLPRAPSPVRRAQLGDVLRHLLANAGRQRRALHEHGRHEGGAYNRAYADADGRHPGDERPADPRRVSRGHRRCGAAARAGRRRHGRERPGCGRNAGAGDATGDIVVFVDADVLPHGDAFVRVRDAFEADPELTAVFGSYDDSRRIRASSRSSGTSSTITCTSRGQARRRRSGRTGAVRADAFRAAGGFDAERYELPSVEDIDLGTRLTANGGRIVLDPLLQGTHLKRWTLADMVRTDFWQRGVPWVELVLRHDPARRR